MPAATKELQKALCCYTTDTLTYINTVREFCVEISTWACRMETKMLSVQNIKVQATVANKREELEKELAAVLEATLRHLKKLSCFLDAVEKLAVTSLHVFMEENQQVLGLPRGIKPEQVQEIIMAARLICPLLIEFKRDADVFVLLKIQNVDVLSYLLGKYIQTTELICEKFLESGVKNLLWNMKTKIVIDLGVDLSGDEIQRMLCHINLLHEIRMDPNFRMVSLFNEELSSRFMTQFSERKPRMLQFLKDLEEVAVQLDRMNKGAKISSVTGSSVGVVSGVLSIVGLALIPVTAGVSLGLIMTGAGLGITSGVNSAVTTVTEMGVNLTQHNKANNVFKSFMDDMQSIQDCLVKSSSQPLTELEGGEIDMPGAFTKMRSSVGTVTEKYGILKGASSAAKSLRRQRRANMMLRTDTTRLASDVPDVGQVVLKGPLALSKSARAGLITLNALFIGMDVYNIYKDSKSLAKGSETEVSQFIRARAALWSSEMDSWQKIHNLLCEGRQKSKKNKAILERPFYPEAQSQFAYMVKHAGYFLLTLPLIGLMFLYYPPTEL